MTTARTAKVMAAVKAIKDFHALGRSVPKKQAQKEAYAQGTVDAEAQKHGVNPDTVRKARQFADPVGGYTPAEVNDLCRLITAEQPHQDDERSVFGRTHLIRLLSVKKQYRAGLQEAAVRGGWSTGELEAQIAARYGSRRDGGRRRRLPADALGLLTQVERLCEGWRRWVALVSANPEQQVGKTKGPSMNDLPPRVRRLVGEAGAALAKLHEAATEELKARRPGRAVRHQFRKALE
ncbi:hypothetical protein [Urbifossiella limnaea]|uniref:Uncharacterized protein n=1 Tax=Urbifossiella limnaea TaxID=2528023 RepID=A0A517XWB2_9BACT|nr:hypothetical protein [Urbifossiella limnaea]QDU21796.1 hypothetical protein ETAA1_37690 [Urbifossiella limnaea]